MTTTTDRDWLTPGGTAYVLVGTMQAGVGSYLTAVKVTVKSVGVRDVKVTEPTGEVRRFRASDLTAPSTGGRWSSDDELVPATDPRVGRALRARRAEAAADRAFSQIDAELKNIVTRPVRHYEDGDAAIDETLKALAAICAAAEAAQRRLASLKAAR